MSTFAIHDRSPTSYLTCYSQKHDGNLAPCYVLDALKAPHIIRAKVCKVNQPLLAVFSRDPYANFCIARMPSNTTNHAHSCQCQWERVTQQTPFSENMS